MTQQTETPTTMRCAKALHDNPADGYLHAADDDTPYSVDGMLYCGRCHYVCNAATGQCESGKTRTPEQGDAPERLIRDGIEWPATEREEPSCARCGGSTEWLRCWDCGGEGVTHHDCGEDTCCCLRPEDNVTCRSCDGEGGALHCANSPEWCNAHPLAGRESITSTALKDAAWND